ncbi:alpha-amylase [Favolaschia claudopus]|uniref:alpha-amylase n=1 Tax=Favolaschia claudopus TaxID=2862362 RepID=A0AAW0DQX3_9AGAR
MLSSLSKIALLSVLSVDCAFAAGGRVLRRAPSKSVNAIVQWPWDSVASECATLASAGYGYVQVSPAQEHIQGSQWWTDYQPVSYKLVSKRGDRSAFAKMVQACNGVGVGVIVDVVFNHMTAGSGTGFAGSTYTKYNYPAAGYTSSNFHYCNGNSASDISNYNDAYKCPYVQQVIAAFLNDLLSLVSVLLRVSSSLTDGLLTQGAAGFRIDAAKHMRDADIASILALVNGTYYDTQVLFTSYLLLFELVIYGNGEAVNPSQYTTTGDVMEFRATTAAQACFLGRDSGAMSSASPWGFVDSSIANYIMANQDTERSGSSLNAQSGNNVYVLSAVFMLGYDYNNNYDAGAPQNSTGYTNQVTCGSNGWRCEHRIQAISSMVAFHNAANLNGSAPLTTIQTGTNQQIAFGRGSIGFLIINNDNQVWSNIWTTSLPAGIYCDIIHGCAQAYNVSSDGRLSASVAPRDALALYIGAPSNGSTTSGTSAVTTTPAASPTSASSSAQVVASSTTATTSSTTTTTTTPQAPVSTAATITFSPTANVGTGETLKVVGSISQLGSWAPSSALTLSQSSGNSWTLTITLPPGTYFEFKYIRVSSSGSVTWEDGSNRVYTAPSAGSSVTLYGTFGSTTSGTSAVTTTGPVASSTSSPAQAVASSSSATATTSSTTTTTTTTTPPAPVSTAVVVTFAPNANVGAGETLKVVGSISQLGSWAPSSALTLSQSSGNSWTLAVTLPPATSFEFKYIRVSSSGSVTWEDGSNRVYTTPNAGSSVTLYGTFG